MRFIAACGPVNGSACATGVAGVAGCGRTGLSIRLPAMVVPRIVTDANVCNFMNAPRVAYNLTAHRCDADFESALVFEP
jgi:hypothetical protein